MNQPFFDFFKKLFLKVIVGILSGSVVRTGCFHCWGLGLIPGQETKILQEKKKVVKCMYNI